MDILGDLVGGQSCAADGTAAARNPISRIVDSLMEGSAGQQQKGRTRRAFNQGGTQDGLMVRPPQGVAPSEAVEARRMQQNNIPLGPRGGAASGGGQWVGPGLNASHQGAVFDQGHHPGDHWVNDFGAHGPLLPPPPPSVQQAITRDLQAAWGTGDGAAAWANEFRSGGAEHGAILPHPAAELEMAWAAHGASRGGVPIMMGPHGHGVMPPMGHPVGHVFPPPFQREMIGTPSHAHEGTSVPSSVTEIGAGDAGPARLESTVSSVASNRESLNRFAAEECSSSIGDCDDCYTVGDTGASRDVTDVRASARALAREMAKDPDGRFRGSELLRLVGGLGEGELSIAGDKVIPVSGAGSMEEAWVGDAGVVAAGEGERLEGPWAWTAQDEGKAADAQQQVPASTSFSDAWAGLDSGIGAHENPSALKPVASSQEEEAWNEAGGAVGNEASAAAGDQDHQDLFMQETMEAAWEAATAEAAAANSIDPDLEAVWDVPEDGVETLDGVWRRTAARLEAGETALGVREEAPYELSADNRFSDHMDPFEEGVRLFEEGQIADAILCFEAEIARNPENSQAWLMLGQSHAENDQDRLAISCLERAVEMDPYSLDALLALGTSYVNELDSQRALHNLKAWVQHNPKYAGLEITVDEYSDGTLMDEVMQLMIQAQRWDPTDADAHVVLGVLYNVSRDYDSAAEAFRRALEARPNDHSLWNKLGATLANHRRSEEALPAYRRAIASKPGYARAWLNMGISQANLNRYEESSACYLQALRLNPEAKHIWSYLRIVLTCMERFDLVQKAAQEDVSLFDQDFDIPLQTPP